MDILHQFYDDSYTRDAVKKFLLEELDRYALEKVYEKKDTHGIADAKESIDRAFTELQEMYEQNKRVEVVNEAK